MDKKITILYLIDTFISPPDSPSEGGAERQLYMLATSLNAYAFKSIVVQLIPYTPQFIALGKVGVAELLHLPTAKFYSAHGLKQIDKLVKIAKREKVDVIHTFFEKSEVMGWLTSRLAGVPVWITSWRDLGFKRKPIYRKIFGVAAKSCSKCVANCQAIKNELIRREKLTEKRIAVIYNGLDFARYAMPAINDTLRSELQVPNDVPIVGMIADMNFEIKGHRYFIEAARRVSDRIPNVEFILVGDGALRKRFERLAEDLGIEQKVHFLGKRGDIPRILSSLNVSVLCSTSEGFSNVILESMAAAKPVVATDVGGSPEIVIDGVTGYLVPPANSHELAKGIMEILKDEQKARKMGEAGRDEVKRRFSVERMVAEHEKLYDSLLAGKGRI